MKTSIALAALAALSTSIAVGCAAPTDADGNGADENVATTTESQALSVEGQVGDPFKYDVAMIVLSRMMNEGFDLFLRQISSGEKSPQELADMLQSIEDLKTHLDETRNSLNSAIAANMVLTQVTSVQGTVANIQLTLEKFEAVVVEGKKIADAKAAGTLQANANVTFDLERAVKEFAGTFDRMGVASAIDTLHNMIVGKGTPGTSFPETYRFKIRTTDRLLSSADSNSLRAAYAYFEEWESVAAMLQDECNIAVQTKEWNIGVFDVPTCTANPAGNEQLRVKLKGYVDAQRKLLPEPIPAGVVIDMGPKFSDLTTTSANKTMFVTVDGAYTWRPTDAATATGSVPEAIAKLSTPEAGGATWHVPTQAELAPLFANVNVAAHETTTQHLNKVFGTKDRFAGQDFIWTSTQTKQQIEWQIISGEYPQVYSQTYTTQTSFSVETTGAKFQGAPLMPKGDATWRDPKKADAAANEKWSTVKGGVIAAKSTGTTIYM